MRIETKFIQNYLSKGTFFKGREAVILVLSLCALASWLYWSPDWDFQNDLAANYISVVEEGEYWRLFTTTFVHGDLNHLLSNSFMLSILTYFVSAFYGTWISVGLAFVVAMLTNLFVLHTYGGSVTLVGASGVIFYLWGFWMVLYMFLQRQYSLPGRALRLGAVFLVLLVPTEYQPNTSYMAHYIGFGLGLCAGAVYYIFNRTKLLSAEVWYQKEVSDELTEFDEIALSYPGELED